MQLRSGCFTASPSGAIFRAGIKLLPSSYTSIVQLLTRKSRETNSSNPSLPILDSQTPRSTITNLPVMQIRKALFNLGISSLTESGEKLNKPALSARLYDVLHNPSHQQPKCLPSEVLPADVQMDDRSAVLRAFVSKTLMKPISSAAKRVVSRLKLGQRAEPYALNAFPSFLESVDGPRVRAILTTGLVSNRQGYEKYRFCASPDGIVECIYAGTEFLAGIEIKIKCDKKTLDASLKIRDAEGAYSVYMIPPKPTTSNIQAIRRLIPDLDYLNQVIHQTAAMGLKHIFSSNLIRRKKKSSELFIWIFRSTMLSKRTFSITTKRLLVSFSMKASYWNLLKIRMHFR